MRAAQLHSQQPWSRAKQPQARPVAASGKETLLKFLIFLSCLPEGLSFFIGDFRLSLARLLIIPLTIYAIAQYLRRPSKVFVPSDAFAAAAGLWMVLAAIVIQGPVAGLKSGGIMALEFSGPYFIFRTLLGSADSSVRIVAFTSKLLFVIVAIAVLDPLTNKPFTYEFIKAITGYTIPDYEWAKETLADTLYRGGIARAMGPFEHSILFGTFCAWVGTLAICTFPTRFIGWSTAIVAFFGILASQARGPLIAYALSLGLTTFYYVFSRFPARWKLLGTLFALGVIFLSLSSSSPLATIMNLSGIDSTTRWHREAIWDAVVPLIIQQSPIFGLGVDVDWDWFSYGLYGPSVDSLWLRIAMTMGIPASFLVLFTMIGAYWKGSLDRSQYLSREERRLSVALGVITLATIFIGFTVHIWGTCWLFLGIFAGMRANLVETNIYRSRTTRVSVEK
jgi:hypothetical protein